MGRQSRECYDSCPSQAASEPKSELCVTGGMSDMAVRLAIHLSDDERRFLEDIVAAGGRDTISARHAQIVLALDEAARSSGRAPTAVATMVGVSKRTVGRVKQRFLSASRINGLRQSRVGPRRRGSPPTGWQQELRALVATPRSDSTRWSTRALSVALEKQGVGSVSHETIRKALKEIHA